MASSAPDHLRTPGLISNRPCYEGIKLYPDNVRVNTIAPGLFRDLTHRGKADIPPRSLARTGHHADIAYAALYLASDEAAWVTGQVLTVDGGVDAGTRPLWEYET